MTPDQAQKLLEFISIYAYEKNWDDNEFLVHKPVIGADTLIALRLITKQVVLYTTVPSQQVMRRRLDGGYDFVKCEELKQGDVVMIQDYQSFEIIADPERCPVGDQVTFHLSKL